MSEQMSFRFFLFAKIKENNQVLLPITINSYCAQNIFDVATMIKYNHLYRRHNPV